MTAFKVSPSALAVRLRQLGLLDRALHDRYRVLSAETCYLRAGAAAEFQRRRAWANAAQLPTRVTSALFKAYSAGDTTLRPLAALLGVEVDWLHSVLDPVPLSEAEPSASEMNEGDPVFTP